jgi:pimeloyl-ACP methyl ester carboxylesterase
MWWFIILAIIAVVAAIPWFQESRRTVINAAARKGDAGAFVKLSRGVTRYQWSGPVRGPVAVLVHGLSTPSIVWDDVAEGLGQLGYRVLTYDLYGRGLSDAPHGAQDRAFFVDQLTELLDDQELTDDLTLIGFSMGGAIATAFAAKNPHRMKQLVLIASAGVLTQESQFSAFCRKVPLLGDWVHSVVGVRRMARSLTETPDATGAVLEAQKAELDRAGFLRSVLSSRRGLLSEMQEAEHRAIGRDGVPVVAVWGMDDPVIPIAAVGRMAQWNRAARQDQIAGGGHGIPYTHSGEIIDLLRDTFRDV